MTPTGQAYRPLAQAFRHFNTEIFDGALPPVLLTLKRSGRTTRGHYTPGRFKERTGAGHADEIALNPSYFREPLEQTLATLVHLMTHAWQQHFGSPSRNGYHNREWADKMLAIGLRTSSNGLAGGKVTGQQMSQYAISNGNFDKSTRRLMQNGFDIVWAESLELNDAASNSVPGPKGRMLWHCPQCRQKAWAKPTAKLACGRCQTALICLPRP